MAAEEPPSRLGVRCLAASGASLVSALVVNPFDVIKVKARGSLCGLITRLTCPVPVNFF